MNRIVLLVVVLLGLLCGGVEGFSSFFYSKKNIVRNQAISRSGIATGKFVLFSSDGDNDSSEISVGSSSDSSATDSSSTTAVAAEPVATNSNQASAPVATNSNQASSAPVTPSLNDQSPIALLSEEIREMTEGLEVFQAEAFKSLYDKDVKWRMAESEEEVRAAPVRSSPAKQAPVQEDTPAVAAVAPTPVVVTPPVITEVFEKPKTGLTTTAGTVAIPNEEVKEVEGFILSNIPISNVVQPSKDIQKLEILKAQQAIAKSFLSLGEALSENDLNKINSISTMADDELDSLTNKNAKKTSAAAAAAAASSSSTTASAPSSGFFSFLSPKANDAPKVTTATTPPSTVSKAKVTTPAPAPVAAKATPPVAPKVTAKVVEKAPSAPAPVSQQFGGFLNFLQSDPNVGVIAAAKESSAKAAAAVPPPQVTSPTKPTPAVVVTKPVATSEPEKSSSGGFFGMFGSKPTETKPVEEVKPAVAMATKPKTSPVPVKAAPTPVAKAAPVAATKPVPTPEPVQSSGGFFGFLSSKPAETKPIEEKPVVAIATKPKVVTPVPVTKPAAVPVVTKTVPVPEPEKSSSGGFFGMFGSKPAETKPVEEVSVAMATKPKAVPAAPAKTTTSNIWGGAPKASPVQMKPADGPSMNAKYQLTASNLLKKDPVKIRAFQKATDQYRSADIDVQQFLTSLENLFGREDLESVVQPLIEGLPEKEIGKTLKVAFDKKYKAPAVSSGGSLFGLFGGGGSSPQKTESAAVTPAKVAPKASPVPKTTPAAPVAATAKPSSPFSGGFFGGGNKPATPATTPAVVTTPVVAAVVKVSVPGKVPPPLRNYVEEQLKGLANGIITPQVFYTNVSKSMGKPKTKELLPDFMNQISKDKAAKLSATFAAVVTHCLLYLRSYNLMILWLEFETPACAIDLPPTKNSSHPVETFGFNLQNTFLRDLDIPRFRSAHHTLPNNDLPFTSFIQKSTSQPPVRFKMKRP
eukprot:gene5334-10666_t